jgi:hypothetical protein
MRHRCRLRWCSESRANHSAPTRCELCLRRQGSVQSDAGHPALSEASDGPRSDARRPKRDPQRARRAVVTSEAWAPDWTSLVGGYCRQTSALPGHVGFDSIFSVESRSRPVVCCINHITSHHSIASHLVNTLNATLAEME